MKQLPIQLRQYHHAWCTVVVSHPCSRRELSALRLLFFVTYMLPVKQYICVFVYWSNFESTYTCIVHSPCLKRRCKCCLELPVRQSFKLQSDCMNEKLTGPNAKTSSLWKCFVTMLETTWYPKDWWIAASEDGPLTLSFCLYTACTVKNSWTCVCFASTLHVKTQAGSSCHHAAQETNVRMRHSSGKSRTKQAATQWARFEAESRERKK